MNKDLFSNTCNILFALSCKTHGFQQISEFAASGFDFFLIDVILLYAKSIKL